MAVRKNLDSVWVWFYKGVTPTALEIFRRQDAKCFFMKSALIIVGCFIGIVFLVLLMRSRIVPTNLVTANQIPEVISQLQQSANDGHFVVLMFDPPGSTDGVAVNLQYSIDKGIVGFDWVLLGPRNITDKEKIIEFASNHGYKLEENEMNNVRFLRMTGSGISDLGIKVITDFYKIDPNAKLGMITEGFKWQPSR